MNNLLKNIVFPAIVATATLLSLMASSCNRDKCKTVICANNGVCNSGACTCQAGYEGSNCETLSRDKFLGNWTVFEKGSTSLAAQYPVIVSASDNNITEVIIQNFNNYFTTPLPPIIGSISGNTIYIPNQKIAGKVVIGQGYIYSNVTYVQYGSLSLSYEVVDSATQRVDDYGYYAPDLSNPSAWNK